MRTFVCEVEDYFGANSAGSIPERNREIVGIYLLQEPARQLMKGCEAESRTWLEFKQKIMDDYLRYRSYPQIQLYKRGVRRKGGETIYTDQTRITLITGHFEETEINRLAMYYQREYKEAHSKDPLAVGNGSKLMAYRLYTMLNVKQKYPEYLRILDRQYD